VQTEREYAARQSEDVCEKEKMVLGLDVGWMIAERFGILNFLRCGLIIASAIVVSDKLVGCNYFGNQCKFLWGSLSCFQQLIVDMRRPQPPVATNFEQSVLSPGSDGFFGGSSSVCCSTLGLGRAMLETKE
jgi:hypothetical protein